MINNTNIISEILKEVDSDFQPPLSSKLVLNDYANKLLDKATFFSVFENSTMCAFIAFYDNDEDRENAYLSMLAVRLKYRGLGLGESLLKHSIRVLKRKSFKYYNLEVFKNNDSAIKLYLQNNFEIIRESEASYKMTLNLR